MSGALQTFGQWRESMTAMFPEPFKNLVHLFFLAQ